MSTTRRLDGPKTLAHLFDHHSQRVYGFLLARTGSRDLAEELTASTFEHAARHLARRPDDVPTEAWLVTVAKRRLVDHWRRLGRERSRMERLRNEQLAGIGQATASAGHHDERIELVREALSTLPLRQRAALTLMYLDEYSVDEVAEILDTSYQATESLLARARRSLAAAVEGART